MPRSRARGDRRLFASRRRRSGPVRHGASVAVLALVVPLVGLAACTPAPPLPSPTPLPTTDAPTTPPPPSPVAPPPVLQPAGAPESIASGLDAPWSILVLPNGGVLVSERDRGDIVEVLADGSLRVAATVPGVAPGGEGGLLGLAFLAGDGDRPDRVYAYHTAESDNRVVRLPLGGAPGALTLGAVEPVLTGIPRGGANHNGGRIAFGPDGLLYVTSGDAGGRDAAQDPASLSGKILRVTADGAPAPGNPFGNAVWTLGHRNPQGLAWDARGEMWAAEFGQNALDELNRISRGGNYGWPIVEGAAGDGRFIDPVSQWPTSEASPSGLAVIGDTLFLAALRGERVWTVAPATAGGALAVTPWFTGELGRIRDVAAGPDGSLWLLSNNTDGRGSPEDGDDRLYRVPLAPAG
ncbi:PQQ-dependent sugar dehydrogenase [Agromyces badenianii]|uniref:PQQ-dependent sugar dehydrogenase n=1 Tax=Agromyces badenianii TaxID=2080742 RepID=UPI000D58F51F|nr:PQQ-dependent sugar dehydrogenase [Agromyces badenianii]PWC05083.1 glucose dehydrogenase [Agromyces badenianii]